MKLKIDLDLDTQEMRFSGSFAHDDMEMLDLSQFDRALLRDCGGPSASDADRLLALELLFRRSIEAYERKDVDLGRLVPQHGSGP